MEFPLNFIKIMKIPFRAKMAPKTINKHCATVTLASWGARGRKSAKFHYFMKVLKIYKF